MVNWTNAEECKPPVDDIVLLYLVDKDDFYSPIVMVGYLCQMRTWCVQNLSCKGYDFYELTDIDTWQVTHWLWLPETLSLPIA
jgi:hypothetical protein